MRLNMIKPSLESAMSEFPSCIAEQFYPLITVLRLFVPYNIETKSYLVGGTCSSKAAQPANCVHYNVPKLSWRRPLALYPALLLFITLVSSSISIFNVGLDISFPLRLVKMIKLIEPSIFVQTFFMPANLMTYFFGIGILNICGSLVLFVGSKQFVSWLNGWGTFEGAFHTCYRDRLFRINIRKLRNNLLLFYFAIPSASWIGCYCTMFTSSNGVEFHFPVVAHCWLVWSTFLMMCAPLLEDVKIILMLAVLHMSYKETKLVIREEVEMRRTIYRYDIFAWTGILVKLRRQVKGAGEYLKAQMLLDIAGLIMTNSVGWFTVIKGFQSISLDQNEFFVTVSVFYCVFNLLRIYLKVNVAERLYAEEREFLEDITDWEQRGLPDSVLNEVRNLRSMLVQTPTIINLGSYTNFDNKLLIQICFHILTLLIAVAQFHSS